MRERLEDMFRSGQVDAVLSLAEEYFGESAPPSRDSLWIAVTAMKAAAAKLQWGKVIDWGGRALVQQIEDREALGLVFMYTGVAFMYLGNVTQAESALAKFQRIANKNPSLQGLLPFAQFNRALLMRFVKRPEAEVRRFRQALRSFQALGQASRVVQCHLEIVWSYLLRGEGSAARLELERVPSDLGASDDPDLWTDCQFAWALYFSVIGQRDKSDKMCLELAHQDNLTARHRADMAWLLGCNARGRKDYGAALGYAAEAEQWAAQDYWPLQMERIEDLKRQSIAN